MSDALELGPFRVGPPIGRGGMGTVYRATHQPSGQPAAIKALDLRYATADRRRSFRHEVELIAALDHPGIIPIYDHGIVPRGPEHLERPVAGTPYLVMAFAEWGSLASYSRDLDWPSIAATLEATLDALAHAHARGCVHCDLKPHNILLTARSGRLRPVLADFGVAHAFRGAARTELVGTPRYMAPEQFTQPRDIGPWTDLYAIGCVAWELLCHTLPVHAESSIGYAMAHMRRDRAEFSTHLLGVPPDIVPWLGRMMAREWRHRFRSAAEARAALARFAPVDAELLLDRPHMSVDADPLAATCTQDTAHTAPLGRVEAVIDQVPTPIAVEPRPLPCPADWRAGIAEPSPPLAGVGQALFGLRIPPFVGRDFERDALWRALRAVHTTKECRVVVLSGSAGTGKSRLARWLLERAEELGVGWAVSVTHAVEPLPGDGLAGALAQLIQPTGDDLERICRLRGGHAVDASDGLIARLCSEGADAPAITPAARYEAIGDFLGAITRGVPPVVLLDDAQWGLDGIGFAEHWRAAGRSGLMVLTVRSDLLDDYPATAKALAQLGEQPEAVRIELPPLDRAAHGEFVRRLLPLDPATVEHLVDRTEGHPLFAMQLIADWLDHGALQAAPAGFAINAAAAEAVPASLAALWGPRLTARLPAVADRRAVELGATLGVRIRSDEWQAVCRALGVEPGDDLLDRLARAGMVRADRQGWRFAHGLLRDAVLSLIPHARRRARLHKACATGLGTLSPERSARAMRRIAEHWIAAGEPSVALGPLRAAAWLLIDRMEASPVVPVLARHDALLEELGAAPDDPRRVRSMVLHGYLAFAEADLERTRSLCAAARPAVEAHQLESERGRLLRLRGMMARADGDLERALRFLGAAEQQCAAVGLWAEAGKAALGRSIVYRMRANLAETERALAEAEAHLARAADPFWLDTVHIERGRVLADRGRWTEARDLIRQAVGDARRHGDASTEARALHVLALMHRAEGRYAEGRRMLEASATLYERSNNINTKVMDAERAVHALVEGRWGDAGALAQGVLDQLAGTMWANELPTLHLICAVAALARGEPEIADGRIADFEGAMSTFLRMTNTADIIERVAHACEQLGQTERAARVTAHAEAVWRALGHRGPRGG